MCYIRLALQSAVSMHGPNPSYTNDVHSTRREKQNVVLHKSDRTHLHALSCKTNKVSTRRFSHLMSQNLPVICASTTTFTKGFAIAADLVGSNIAITRRQHIAEHHSWLQSNTLLLSDCTLMRSLDASLVS